jgi:hypothetical protein
MIARLALALGIAALGGKWSTNSTGSGRRCLRRFYRFVATNREGGWL